MEQHRQNLDTYLSNGGDPKLAKRYAAATLENRAKIAYYLSQMKVPENFPKTFQEISTVEKKVSEKPRQLPDTVGQVLDRPKPTKPKFIGLITQYPVGLHQTYNDAFSIWLQLCSLKIQLNEISEAELNQAYDLQTKMLISIKKFDKCKEALDHYSANKRVLATVSKRNFEGWSELKLDLERRNLASNICKRKQTIARMEANLPEESDLNYRKRLAAIHLKRETLQEFILDAEKIDELLKVSK